MSLDQFFAAGSTALGLALLMLAMFIRGDIVPGSVYREQHEESKVLRQAIDRLASAMEIRNRVDEKLLERDERRIRTHGGRAE